MTDLRPVLDWQAVLLVKVHKQALLPHHLGLSVSRMHVAQHPDGILASGWDVPMEERQYLRAQLVGWKPARDVPFELPVQFYRNGDPRVSTLIPAGTWVLPYDDALYNLYLQFQEQTQSLMQDIEANPVTPDLRAMLIRFVGLFNED